MSVCALTQPQQKQKQKQKQKSPRPAAGKPLLTPLTAAGALPLQSSSSLSKNQIPPTPPPSPQVRIYEDFDRMSAKEVYYNEAGKKVTVKLLHFPDVSPEDIAKLRFDDEDDDEEAEKEEEDEENDSRVPKKAAADSDEDAGSEAETNNGHPEAHATGGGSSSGTTNNTTSSTVKKLFRRKLSGNNMQSRKCSLAFAQAHGIRQRAEKKLSMPTISITANSGDQMAHNMNLNLNLAGSRKLSQQHSLPPGSGSGSGSPSSPTALGLGPRRSHSPLGQSLCPGYIQYSKSLLEVPMPRDYGYASSDDLSSEWDSDVSTSGAPNASSGSTAATAAGGGGAPGTKK
ncbi:Hypothetical predicted protein, partial [Drosophila guanche]